MKKEGVQTSRQIKKKEAVAGKQLRLRMTGWKRKMAVQLTTALCFIALTHLTRCLINLPTWTHTHTWPKHTWVHTYKYIGPKQH